MMYALYSPVKPNVVALVSLHYSYRTARYAKLAAEDQGRRVYIEKISRTELLLTRFRRWLPTLLVAGMIGIGIVSAAVSTAVYDHVTTALAGPP